MDLVTAIITTCKREPAIVERAIKSIINQTYSNMQYVLVDDSPEDYEFRDDVKKIAQKYQVGISEIISANSQFKNPNMIYPGDKVTIPLLDNDTKNFEQQVVNLVNQQRSKNGLLPLTMNWQVSRVARYKSQDMCDRNYFSHQSPTYGSPFDMLKQFNINYSSAGENIAKGQKTPQAVMNSWMNSQGHRQNILNKNFTQIGVGYYNKNGTTYWTQMFIRP